MYGKAASSLGATEGLERGGSFRTLHVRPNPIEERERVYGRQGMHPERGHGGDVLHICVGLGAEQRYGVCLEPSHRMLFLHVESDFLIGGHSAINNELNVEDPI